jgi:hypothetical protein
VTNVDVPKDKSADYVSARFDAAVERAQASTETFQKANTIIVENHTRMRRRSRRRRGREGRERKAGQNLFIQPKASKEPSCRRPQFSPSPLQQSPVRSPTTDTTSSRFLHFSQEASLQMQFGTIVMQGDERLRLQHPHGRQRRQDHRRVVYSVAYQKGNELGAVAMRTASSVSCPASR